MRRVLCNVIFVILGVSFLVGCEGARKIRLKPNAGETIFRTKEAEMAMSTPSEEFDPVSLKKPAAAVIRVGVLLPLSGASEKLGLALQRATLMSLFDAQNPKVVLQFYDTEGTAEGARLASETAIAQGAKLIIGPVFSHEVRAIRPSTHKANIGVITFSSHPQNMGDGIYTISTLTSQQVEHVVAFACDRGYKRLGILAQDNALGDIVSLALKRTADRCEAFVTKAAFYDPKTENLLPVVASIMPPVTDEEEKEKERELLRLEKLKETVELGVPVKILNEVWVEAQKEAKRKAREIEKAIEQGKEIPKEEPKEEPKNENVLEMQEEEIPQWVEQEFTPEEFQAYIDAYREKEIEREPFEFDALLISEEGSKLRSLAALLSYFDVPDTIRILGTSQWAESRPQRESALVGGWFSNLPSKGFEAFIRRYKELYNETPARIVSQAYDAVALTTVLAEVGDFSYKALTSPYGFKGVDGLFRLLPNGLSERGLEILGVEKRGFVTLSPAKEAFDTEPFFEVDVYEKDFRHSSHLIYTPAEPETEADADEAEEQNQEVREEGSKESLEQKPEAESVEDVSDAPNESVGGFLGAPKKPHEAKPSQGGGNFLTLPKKPEGHPATTNP